MKGMALLAIGICFCFLVGCDERVTGEHGERHICTVKPDHPMPGATYGHIPINWKAFNKDIEEGKYPKQYNGTKACNNKLWKKHLWVTSPGWDKCFHCGKHKENDWMEAVTIDSFPRVYYRHPPILLRANKKEWKRYWKWKSLLEEEFKESAE